MEVSGSAARIRASLRASEKSIQHMERSLGAIDQIIATTFKPVKVPWWKRKERALYGRRRLTVKEQARYDEAWEGRDRVAHLIETSKKSLDAFARYR